MGEEAQADIMIRAPRDLRVGVFTWELITDKMLYGTWAGILCLVSFIIVVFGNGNGKLVQTVTKTGTRPATLSSKVGPPSSLFSAFFSSSQRGKSSISAAAYSTSTLAVSRAHSLSSKRSSTIASYSGLWLLVSSSRFR